MARTELWSFDRKKGRSINATLSPVERKFELDMRWSDGEKVEFPMKLTAGDLRRLIDLVQESAIEGGLEI